AGLRIADWTLSVASTIMVGSPHRNRPRGARIFRGANHADRSTSVLHRRGGRGTLHLFALGARRRRGPAETEAAATGDRLQRAGRPGLAVESMARCKGARVG